MIDESKNLVVEYLTAYVRTTAHFHFEESKPLQRYMNIQDYVLDNGKTQVVSEPLSDQEYEALMGCIDRVGIRFEMRQCFHNSQLACIYSKPGPNQLKYTEGFAIGRSGFPTHHAWLTVNGKVIDLTWRTKHQNHKGRLRDRIFGVIPDGWYYMGVDFPTKDVVSRCAETEETRAFLGDWTRSYPYLCQPRRTANP